MSKQQQAFYQNAQHCAMQLDLPLRQYLWKGHSGEFVGAGVGSSLDFQDHRNYSPGDDPRHINWQAYARSGNYTMKQYREEVRPSIDLILDLSPSLFFTSQKKQRTCELLYLIQAIARKNGAELGIHFILANHYIPSSHESLDLALWLEHIPKKIKQEQVIAPNLERIPMRHGSLRVFISDLLFEGDPINIINPLNQGQGKPIFFVPYTNEEESPLWDGNYDLVDAEVQTKHSYQINKQTLQAYKRQYANHFALWQEAAKKIHAPFARIPADFALFSSLKKEAIPQRALVFS